MAKKEIVWTLEAIHDKLNILDYWIDKTYSKAYSIQLNALFDKALEQVSLYPELGKTTHYKDVRIKIVRHYLLFYRISDDTIQVIRLIDLSLLLKGKGSRDALSTELSMKI